MKYAQPLPSPAPPCYNTPVVGFFFRIAALFFFLYDCVRFGAALYIGTGRDFPLVTVNALFPAMSACVLFALGQRVEIVYAIGKGLFVFAFAVSLLFSGFEFLPLRGSAARQVIFGIFAIFDTASIVVFLLSTKKARVELEIKPSAEIAADKEV